MVRAVRLTSDSDAIAVVGDDALLFENVVELWASSVQHDGVEATVATNKAGEMDSVD